jgi:biopolymer transport protein ExbB
MATWFADIAGLMSRGGVVMWPLLALSILGVALVIERSWFYIRTNGFAQLKRLEALNKRLRAGDRSGATALAEQQAGVYADVADRLLSEPATEAAATDAIESQRARLERFLPTLSTIITAAPMLGILGTVLGIIDSFEVLGGNTTDAGTPGGADPAQVGRGIAEALITTAAGLVVALVILLPYNLLRSQVDRTLSRLESLASAAITGLSSAQISDTPNDEPTEK